MENIKRKNKPQFSLKDISKQLKELTKNIKVNINDTSFLFLLRQHTRTQYISLAFVRAMQDELTGLHGISRTSENLQAIVLNTLEYVKKNFKCLSDVIMAASVSMHSA